MLEFLEEFEIVVLFFRFWDEILVENELNPLRMIRLNYQNFSQFLKTFILPISAPSVDQHTKSTF
jgi:hypothetical protein